MDTGNAINNISNNWKITPITFFITCITLFLVLLNTSLLFDIKQIKNFFGLGSLDDNKNTKKNSINPKEQTIKIVVIVIIALLLLVFSFLSTKNTSYTPINIFLQQTNNLVYIVLYAILFILLMNTIPYKYLNDYAYLVVPLSVFMSSLLFYKGLNSDYYNSFNLNYEKIKIVTIICSLLFMFMVYYSIDPGNYIYNNKNFAFFSLIIMCLFLGLYLISIITFAIKNNTTTTNISNSSSSSNTSNKNEDIFMKIFKFITNYSFYGTLLFVLFLIITMNGIYNYPGGFLNNKNTSVLVSVFTLIICIVWGSSLFIDYKNDTKIQNMSSFIFLKKSILTLLYLFIFGIFFFWILSQFQNITSTSTPNIISIILSIFLITAIFGILYKTYNTRLPNVNGVNINKNKQGFFDLFLSLLFYIPCLLRDIYNEIFQTNKNNLVALLIVLFLFTFFTVVIPIIYKILSTQGGKLLINEPITLNKKTNLSGYQELNETEKQDNPSFNYQYGISFWTYIDALPPNTNASYNKFTSLLNYGNKPNILYNAKTGELIFTIDPDNVDEKNNSVFKHYDKDENNNIIIYKTKDFLQQKWNHIVFNYAGGNIDIFINGELVKSIDSFVPYMTYDTLVSGEENGLIGQICNTIYFKNPLSKTNIYYLYNIVKNDTPPLSSNLGNIINVIFKDILKID